VEVAVGFRREPSRDRGVLAGGQVVAHDLADEIKAGGGGGGFFRHAPMENRMAARKRGKSGKSGNQFPLS